MTIFTIILFCIDPEIIDFTGGVHFSEDSDVMSNNICSHQARPSYAAEGRQGRAGDLGSRPSSSTSSRHSSEPRSERRPSAVTLAVTPATGSSLAR